MTVIGRVHYRSFLRWLSVRSSGVFDTSNQTLLRDLEAHLLYLYPPRAAAHTIRLRVGLSGLVTRTIKGSPIRKRQGTSHVR